MICRGVHQMKKHLSTSIFFGLLALMTSCAPRMAKGHLYRTFRGREETFEIALNDPKSEYGHLKIITQNNVFVGDYSPVTTPTEISKSQGGGGSLTIAGFGGGLNHDSSFSAKFEPGMESRLATIVINQNIMITLHFQIDPKTGHGTGLGRDNRGGSYTMQF